jgi:hypothetical protein
VTLVPILPSTNASCRGWRITDAANALPRSMLTNLCR